MFTTETMPTWITVEDTGRIAALEPDVYRNLCITQSYYALSAAIAARLAPGANWCTFATWASRQAGQTIRKEDLNRALEAELDEAPELAEAFDRLLTTLLNRPSPPEPARLRRLFRDLLGPTAVMNRASEAVARGNQKVYAEIGREFARFSASCLNDKAFDAASLEAFCAMLRPGDPQDGQQYLRSAFSNYYAALFAADSKTRAEHMLLANIQVGFHEQTRLQPEIAEALETALPDPAELADRLSRALFPRSAPLLRLGWGALRLFGRRARLDAAIDHVVHTARMQIRRFLTDRMMTLELPGRRLRLDEDLRRQFPDDLRTLTLPALQTLLRQVDPTPDSLRATGAVDWADFNERIHYIVDLFRCFHFDPELMTPPFTEQRVAGLEEMRSGGMSNVQ